MRRYAGFFLALYNRHAKENFPVKGSGLYVRIASGALMQFLYRISPKAPRKLFFKMLLADNPAGYFMTQSLFNVKRFIAKAGSAALDAVVGRIARRYIVENENAVFNAIMASANRSLSEYQLDYSLKEDFIIGTSSGLWYLSGDTLHQLTYASSYGIAYYGDRWYANQNIGQFSRIISFVIDTESNRPALLNPSYFSLGLPKSVHQIDFYNEILFAVDTLNNRVITMDNRGKKRYYSQNRDSIKAKVNNHFNSIFIKEGFIYLCAHNGTLKPKRYSEIFVLHRGSMKTHNVIQTSAGNAHNVLIKDEKLFYCDSMAGQLICEKEAVFKDPGYFMRGLAITDSYVLVGGSAFARREERASTDGVVFILDSHFNHIKTMELKNIGQIYEIRGVNGDFGLSAYNKNYCTPVKQQ
jgi:hypothetical protein